MKNLITKILFPPHCPCCGELLDIGADGICPDCGKGIRVIGDTACICCGKPLYDKGSAYCTDCMKRGGHYFLRNFSAVVYEGRVKQSMYSLKYHGAKWIGRYWGRTLAILHFNRLMENYPDIIIPVPTHRKKELKRGYNQAEVIADSLAKEWRKRNNGRAPRVRKIVVRGKETGAQKKLGADLRQKNLKKAFKLDESVVELKGLYRDRYNALFRRVLLVDDILTTGATLDAIAQLLMEERIADEVYAITVAVGDDIGDRKGTDKWRS